MAYAGRLAIIAGGLGGLATSTAQLLRSKGAHLALLYAPFESSRRDSVLEKSYGSSKPSGITTYECDITSESSVNDAFESLTSTAVDTQNSFPSILINAAGYVTVQPLEETSGEECAKNLIPNVVGPFLVSKAFFHLYQAQKSVLGDKKAPPGRIVSISSQAAHRALDGHGPYCASKAGLLGLTRCMANEWASRGITSNTVSPTVVLTELGKKAWADDKKRNAHLAQIPTGRFAEPEEIAHAIEFLCQDGSAMINGEDIKVDGGFVIRGTP